MPGASTRSTSGADETEPGLPRPPGRRYPLGMTSPAAPRRRLVRAATFGLLAAAAGCAVQTGDEPTGQISQASVCAAGTVVKGVDVSVYQGTINWTTVKGAGIDFAIARISDGSALDTDFAANWSGMKSAGLVRGA